MFHVGQFSSDKILSHIERIYEWCKTGDTKPITYELDVTNICNHKCPLCFGFLDMKNNSQTLSKEKAKDILKQIRAFGGKAVTFTGGGEPLSCVYTIELVEYANDLKLEVGFITNGSLLTPLISERLLNNCSWIRISLDASMPEKYKKSHGMDEAHFNKVIENIKVLTKLKQEKQSRTVVGVGYLTPSEPKDLERFVFLGRTMKADYIQFRPYLPSSDSPYINYDTKETTEFIFGLCEKYTEENYKVLCSKHKYDNMKDGKLYRKYGKCYGHSFVTIIAADGKMYLCCHMRGKQEYCLGDLMKNSLKEIWNSKQRKHVYQNIDFRDCPYLCRCDTFNMVLWNIRKKKEHVNFL